MKFIDIKNIQCKELTTIQLNLKMQTSEGYVIDASLLFKKGDKITIDQHTVDETIKVTLGGSGVINRIWKKGDIEAELISCDSFKFEAKLNNGKIKQFVYGQITLKFDEIGEVKDTDDSLLVFYQKTDNPVYQTVEISEKETQDSLFDILHIIRRESRWEDEPHKQHSQTIEIMMGKLEGVTKDRKHFERSSFGTSSIR
tara:strand:- start:8 stop:604 length:597 start_codon:yes stop_codon:yes gene_type:complete